MGLFEDRIAARLGDPEFVAGMREAADEIERHLATRHNLADGGDVRIEFSRKPEQECSNRRQLWGDLQPA